MRPWRRDREYEKRASRYWPLEVIEVREESGKGASPEIVKQREGERLRERIGEPARAVVCDPGGKSLDSAQFSAWLQGERESGRDFAFPTTLPRGPSMNPTITFTGARGGHGTTTVAAAVAAHAARNRPTTLVSTDAAAAKALLGLVGDEHEPVGVVPTLALTADAPETPLTKR